MARGVLVEWGWVEMFWALMSTPILWDEHLSEAILTGNPHIFMTLQTPNPPTSTKQTLYWKLYSFYTERLLNQQYRRFLSSLVYEN